MLIVETERAPRAALRARLQAAGHRVWAGGLRLLPDGARFDERLQADDDESTPAPRSAAVALALIELDTAGSLRARGALALAAELAALHRPVVFCVRQHEGAGQAAALAHGAFAYFVKPVAPALVLGCLPAWLARAAELRALRRERGSLLEALRSSRVVGTAVGILAERHRLTPEQAFDDLRRSARAERQAITELARRVATGPMAGKV